MAIPPLPDGELVVSSGDLLPDCEAQDATAARRTLSEWRGRRVVLEFFRGSW